MPPESFAALTLARVLRPWGRHGEVAAEILTDFPERLASLAEVWLADGSGAQRRASIVACRLPAKARGRGRQAIFQFAGVSTISEAEKLRGLEIQVPLSERVALPAGRYYISELVGCEVWEENAAARLGTVREVQSLAEAGERAAEAWVLSVETAQGELLVPLAAEICTRVDIATQRIEVRLPKGLREINR